MSDRDNITLPRKHIDYAAHALEHFNKDAPDPLVSEIIHHLRTALAAEQPKPEPVAVVGTQSAAWKGYDGRWSPPGDPIKVGHLLRDLPLGTLLYTAPPDAEALRRDAFRKGFYAGFAATGEGWNGEYPFQDKNRPIAGDPSVEAAIDAAMKEGT